jgi:CheY-like chemotaxis protein
MAELHRHILLAEDDMRMRLMLSTILREAGYKVTSAQNGKDASLQIRSLQGCNQTIDLMVLDIYMPGMNGMQLMERLEKENNVLPTVVITGYAHTDLVDRLKSKGCSHILHKPFNADELLAAINEVLQQQTAA